MVASVLSNKLKKEGLWTPAKINVKQRRKKKRNTCKQTKVCGESNERRDDTRGEPFLSGEGPNESAIESTLQESGYESGEKVHFQSPTGLKFVAVDASGGWMNRWNNMMESLNVHYLRSPLSAHPGIRSCYLVVRGRGDMRAGFTLVWSPFRHSRNGQCFSV